MLEDFAVISTYTRAQAIEDGVLVDVSSMAKEAGIKFPVAVSRALWDAYVEVPEGIQGQDESGRLWDVLWMFRASIRKSNGTDVILYKLHVAMPDRGDWKPNEDLPERGSDLARETHRLVTLKALCHPGDDPKPVITIMLPEED